MTNAIYKVAKRMICSILLGSYYDLMIEDMQGDWKRFILQINVKICCEPMSGIRIIS